MIIAAAPGEPQLWSSLLTALALMLIGYLGWQQRRNKSASPDTKDSSEGHSPQ
jgi:hypothetical protein